MSICAVAELSAADAPSKSSPRPAGAPPPAPVAQPPAAPPEITQPTLSDVRMLMEDFSRNFKSDYTSDHANMENIGNYVVPTLKNGAIALNNNPITETFTGKTGALTAIFVKSGNDFVVVAASLPKEDGSSARGTALDPYNPAIRTLMSGRGYTGKTILYGKEYLAQYAVIRDKSGKIVGALVVALPVEL